MKLISKLNLMGLAVGLALGASGAALAHGKGGRHLMGAVKAVKPGEILIETQDKETVSVETDEKTRVTRGDSKAKLTDIEVGERAVVHAKKHGGALTAELIKLGAKEPAKAPATREQPTGGHQHHKH